MNLYKGFSSFEFQRVKTFTLTDVELVKMDLLNHIFTKKGERLMMPNFGTIIPELLFEPLDEETLDALYDELQVVFDYDPRVSLIRLEVIPNYDTNTVTASAELFYIELNMTDNFDIGLQFGADQ